MGVLAHQMPAEYPSELIALSLWTSALASAYLCVDAGRTSRPFCRNQAPAGSPAAGAANYI